MLKLLDPIHLSPREATQITLNLAQQGPGKTHKLSHIVRSSPIRDSLPGVRPPNTIQRRVPLPSRVIRIALNHGLIRPSNIPDHDGPPAEPRVWEVRLLPDLIVLRPDLPDPRRQLRRVRDSSLRSVDRPLLRLPQVVGAVPLQLIVDLRIVRGEALSGHLPRQLRRRRMPPNPIEHPIRRPILHLGLPEHEPAHTIPALRRQLIPAPDPVLRPGLPHADKP